MSIRLLPPDVNRLIANAPGMTIGDIHNLSRAVREFNKVYRQNGPLRQLINKARRELSKYYDVIRRRTPTELETDLSSLKGRPNLFRMIEKGYEKPFVSRKIRIPDYMRATMQYYAIQKGQLHVFYTLYPNDQKMSTDIYIIQGAIAHGQWDIVKNILGRRSKYPSVRIYEIATTAAKYDCLDELVVVAPTFKPYIDSIRGMYSIGSLEEIIGKIESGHVRVTRDFIETLVRRDRLDIIKCIVDNRENEDQWALAEITRCAAGNGSLSIVTYFYHRLQNVYDRSSILCRALSSCHGNIIRFLLDIEPQFDPINNFRIALEAGNMENIKLLANRMTSEQRQQVYESHRDSPLLSDDIQELFR